LTGNDSSVSGDKGVGGVGGDAGGLSLVERSRYCCGEESEGSGQGDGEGLHFDMLQQRKKRSVVTSDWLELKAFFLT
jgi:hypothetical protein